MRDQQIRKWITKLEHSFGEPRPLADVTELERLYRAHDYAGMVRSIKERFGLTTPVRFELSSSGAPIDKQGQRARAWCRINLRPFAFRKNRVLDATVYCDTKRIVSGPLEAVTICMSHELSHIMLENTRHSLRRHEEAVDLMAMLLGYRKFYAIHATKVARAANSAEHFIDALMAGKNPPLTRDLYESRVGYLSPEEIRYAARLMQI